ncbi:MAG: Fur family transcriptional regulator [bacterium]|nr:transcriptional repressor [bacterium]
MAADDAVVDRFTSWLRDRGLPVTAQRVAIAEVLFNADRHLSAEEVAAELNGRGNKVGTATVYRTIDVLLESGLVVERDFGEGFRRFETARDVPQHEHLVCTGCGRVEEFRDDRIERIAGELAASRGFTRERHRLVIYGLCRSCRAAANS